MVEEMLGYDQIQESLAHYARSNNFILQKIVIKIIFCMFDIKELRYDTIRFLCFNV